MFLDFFYPKIHSNIYTLSLLFSDKEINLSMNLKTTANSTVCSQEISLIWLDVPAMKY